MANDSNMIPDTEHNLIAGRIAWHNGDVTSHVWDEVFQFDERLVLVDADWQLPMVSHHVLHAATGRWENDTFICRPADGLAGAKSITLTRGPARRAKRQREAAYAAARSEVERLTAANAPDA